MFVVMRLSIFDVYEESIRATAQKCFERMCLSQGRQRSKAYRDLTYTLDFRDIEAIVMWITPKLPAGRSLTCRITEMAE